MRRPDFCVATGSIDVLLDEKIGRKHRLQTYSVKGIKKLVNTNAILVGQNDTEFGTIGIDTAPFKPVIYREVLLKQIFGGLTSRHTSAGRKDPIPHLRWGR